MTSTAPIGGMLRSISTPTIWLALGFALLLLVGVVMIASPNAESEFACVVESDQQNGTTLLFHPAAGLLIWGTGQPLDMTIEREQADPFEIVAVSKRLGTTGTGLHIYKAEDGLRFTANAGDSLSTGRCVSE